MSGRLAGPLWERFLLQAGPPEAVTDGMLFEPVVEGTGVRGGWRSEGSEGLLPNALARMATLPIQLALLGLTTALSAWGGLLVGRLEGNRSSSH